MSLSDEEWCSYRLHGQKWETNMVELLALKTRTKMITSFFAWSNRNTCSCPWRSICRKFVVYHLLLTNIKILRKSDLHENEIYKGEICTSNLSKRIETCSSSVSSLYSIKKKIEERVVHNIYPDFWKTEGKSIFPVVLKTDERWRKVQICTQKLLTLILQFLHTNNLELSFIFHQYIFAITVLILITQIFGEKTHKKPRT